MSPWREIDQALINNFADLTDDHQFIHTSPDLALLTPFGATIAHGFLVLSLLTAMSYQAVPAIAGTRMGVNYGFDRVRFIAPVREGRRVRARFVLSALEPLDGQRLRITQNATVEIEGERKPALIADWISMVWI